MNVIYSNDDVTDIIIDLPRKLELGQTYKVHAQSVPSGSTVTFQSSDSSIVEILPDEDACRSTCCPSTCFIKPKQEGEFDLVMTSGGYQLHYKVTILPEGGLQPEPDPDANKPGIKLETDNLILKKGESHQILYSVKPEDAYVSWKTDCTRVAVVNHYGVVTGVMQGHTRLTARCNGYESYCNVYVNEVGIKDVEYEVAVGKTLELPIKLAPGQSRVYWTTSDERIANVTTETGIITGNCIGRCIISVTVLTDSGPVTQPIRIKVVPHFTPILDLKRFDIKNLTIYDSESELRINNTGVEIKILPEGPLVPKLYYIRINPEEDGIFKYKICAVQSDIDKFLLATTNKDL